MRILTAITVKKPKELADNALRWVSRAGFDLILFTSPYRRKAVETAIEDANYHYYCGLADDMIETVFEPVRIAKRGGYDLLLTIPEELQSWYKNTRFKDREIYVFVSSVAAARQRFSNHPRKQFHRFSNGVIMERVV